MRTERRRPATWCARCCRRIRSARSTRANLLSQPMSEGHRVEMLNRTAGNLVAGEVLQSLWNPSSRVRDGALLIALPQQRKSGRSGAAVRGDPPARHPGTRHAGDGGANARQARNPRGRPRPGCQAEFGGPDAGSGRAVLRPRAHRQPGGGSGAADSACRSPPPRTPAGRRRSPQQNRRLAGRAAAAAGIRAGELPDLPPAVPDRPDPFPAAGHPERPPELRSGREAARAPNSNAG